MGWGIVCDLLLRGMMMKGLRMGRRPLILCVGDDWRVRGAQK